MINAEAGGTAISKVMIDIANAVATGGEDLTGFAEVAGMSSKEFKKAFEEDAANAIVTFIEGLGKISESGGNTFAVLEDLGLKEVRVRDAMLRASGAGNLLRESIELGTTAWEENVALTKEAESRYKTTESQIQILKNRFDDILGTIGDALVPALMSAVTAMEPLLQKVEQAAAWFVKLDPSIQAVSIAIAAIAAAIGPVLVVLGLVISSVGTIITAFTGLSGAIAGAGGAIGILTGPIGLAVAAIVGLGATLVALWKSSETFRDTVIGIWESVKAAAVSVFGAISTFVQEKLGAIKSFWDANGPQFLEAVENVFNGIKAAIEFVMPAVKFIIETVWTAIKQIINGALDVIMGLIKVFSGLFTGDFSKMWEGVKDIFKGAVDLIIGFMTVTFVGGLKTLLTNLVKLGINLIKNLGTGIVNGIKSFATTGQNLAKGMVDGVLKFFTNLYNSAKNIFDMLRTFGASVWNAISQTIVGIARNIWTTVTNHFTGMLNSIKNIFGTVKSTISDIWNGVMNFFRGINLTSIGKDIIRGLINGIGSMASAVWDKAKSIASGIADSIKNTLGISSPSKVMIGFGKNVSEGLSIGMDDMLSKVNQSANRLANAAMINTPDIKFGKVNNTQSNRSSGVLGAVTQNITINSPTALSPSDTARKNLQVARQLAMEWR